MTSYFQGVSESERVKSCFERFAGGSPSIVYPQACSRLPAEFYQVSILPQSLGISLGPLLRSLQLNHDSFFLGALFKAIES